MSGVGERVRVIFTLLWRTVGADGRLMRPKNRASLLHDRCDFVCGLRDGVHSVASDRIYGNYLVSTWLIPRTGSLRACLHDKFRTRD